MTCVKWKGAEMSIFSDYKVGALTEDEFRNECARMNREDRWEREHEYEEGEEDEHMGFGAEN